MTRRTRVTNVVSLVQAVHGLSEHPEVKPNEWKDDAHMTLSAVIGYGTRTADMVMKSDMANLLLLTQLGNLQWLYRDCGWFKTFSAPRRAVVLDLLRTESCYWLEQFGFMDLLQAADHEAIAGWIAKHMKGRRARLYTRIMQSGKWPTSITVA